jgi:cytochrome c-type biogenesis protein CcmH/NrfG
MRSNESPMDFQYENPIKQDPNSPFRLAGLGKSLTFDAQESVQAQKRTLLN